MYEKCTLIVLMNLRSETEAFILIYRWRNWVVRGIFTWVMIFGFSFVIYLGPLALVLLVSSFFTFQHADLLRINNYIPR